MLFSALWAAATLFHIASYEEWRASSLLAAGAAWALLQPGSVAAFVLLALLQLGNAAALSPFISNHWLFTSLVGATILLSVALLFLKHRRLGVDGTDLFATFAPPARLALIIVYFFAVFHKLNTDFFDPTVSCDL